MEFDLRLGGSGPAGRWQERRRLGRRGQGVPTLGREGSAIGREGSERHMGERGYGYG